MLAGAGTVGLLVQGLDSKCPKQRKSNYQINNVKFKPGCCTVLALDHHLVILERTKIGSTAGRCPCGVGTSSLVTLAGGWVNKTSLDSTAATAR